MIRFGRNPVTRRLTRSVTETQPVSAGAPRMRTHRSAGAHEMPAQFLVTERRLARTLQ